MFRSSRIFWLSLLILSCSVLRAEAGGALGAVGGVPIVWDVGANGPVRLLLDRGVLAQHDSAVTWSILFQCVEAWDTVSGSSLRIQLAGYLDYDVRLPNDPVLIGSSTLTDGVVPVVIDNDGSITDAYLGAGAKSSVNGFATPYTSDSRTWTDGRVVINGSRNRNQQAFVQTMTHEFGHLVGLSHNQRNYNAEYALMNPFGGTLDEEDLLALLRLYPEEGALAGRGSLSGRITDAEGNPLSGVNLLAVNTESGEVYSTVSDYYSGGDVRFLGMPVPQQGLYRFDGLPPGTWYIRMEGIDPAWTGGSSVASYDPPINTGLIDDWYNGPEESGAMHLDNLNRKTGVTVAAGEEVEGIDFVENDLTGLTKIAEAPSGSEQQWPTPTTYEGVRIGGYAVRHVAPANGAPVMVRFWAGTWPSIGNGKLVVTVYGNQRQQGVDLPGTVIGTIVIPREQIVANLNYDVWLHEISGLRFNQGDIFHIGLSIDGGNRMEFQFVQGEGDAGTSYLRSSDNTWAPFPIAGNNGGSRSGRLKMETWYSPIRPGDSRVLIAGSPQAVDFGSAEVGQPKSGSVTIANIGTTPMTIDDLVISGPDAAAFGVDGSSIVGESIVPGQRITIPLIYTPQREGSATATLNVNGLVSVAVPMSGTGTISAVGQLVGSIDFGQQLLDESRTIDTVVIHNRGTVSLVAKVAPPVGSGFRLIAPKSDGFFQPGDSLSVVVEFTPGQERDYEDELVLTFRPPRDTIRIPVTGRGVREITGVPVVDADDINLSVAVTPNPARDHLDITVNDPEGREIDVLMVDALGRTVVRPELQMVRGGYRTTTLPTAPLPSGVYRVVIVTEQGIVVRSITILQ